MLAGVEVLADGAPGAGSAGAGDVLVVDVGGATTDVYSVITPRGEDARPRREVVATLWRARTVEGDLGLRWNAPGSWRPRSPSGCWSRRTAEPLRLARTPTGSRSRPDVRCPAPVTGRRSASTPGSPRWPSRSRVRRHGRPPHDGAAAAPAAGRRRWWSAAAGCCDTGRAPAAGRILAPLTADHAGGWRVPTGPRITVDARYTLFAAGLLAPTHPAAAARLAGTHLTDVAVASG